MWLMSERLLFEVDIELHLNNLRKISCEIIVIEKYYTFDNIEKHTQKSDRQTKKSFLVFSNRTNKQKTKIFFVSSISFLAFIASI